MKFVTPISEHQKAKIKKIISENDGCVVFPTETFYALGCSAKLEKAVERIYLLKQRKRSLPLLILIDSWQMYFDIVEPEAHVFVPYLKKFWPGPLTAVLPVKPVLATNLNIQSRNIGVRMTSCPVASELITICGVPLVGTSANLSGKSASVNIKDIELQFGDSVSLYIDGGMTMGGNASTLIQFINESEVEILRQGGIRID